MSKPMASFPRFRFGERHVAIYGDSEVDLRQNMSALQGAGWKVAVPIEQGDDGDFCVVLVHPGVER